MDMVKFIDAIGAPILTGPEHLEIFALTENIAPQSALLTQPRYPLLGLPEFGTVAALDHYTARKRKTLGDFVELRAKTRDYIDALSVSLEALDRMIESSQAVNGTLSLDDIRVLPLLRSAAVVKGLRFPDKVRGYFESMMSMIGYQPLPAI
jgi:glutaredoxin 2